MAMPTIAESVAETAIPMMINCSALRASQKVSKVESSAPQVAHPIEPIEAMFTALLNTPITTPRAAPAVVPRNAGSANGLLVEP